MVETKEEKQHRARKVNILVDLAKAGKFIQLRDRLNAFFKAHYNLVKSNKKRKQQNIKDHFTIKMYSNDLR